IFLTRRFFNLFVGGLVFQCSSDFFRKRLSLYFYLRQVPQEYTPRRFARKQIDCSGVVFLKGLLSVLPGESG
ncbi:MAG: hypothetical protein ACK56I_34255, partial [bacterium]